MKLREEMGERPVFLEYVLLGVGVTVITPFAMKFTMELLGGCSLLLLGVGLYKQTSQLFMVWRIAAGLWLLAAFLPVDLSVVNGDVFAVRWVRIVTSIRALPSVNPHNNGEKTYETIGYPPGTIFVTARRALLVIVPTEIPLKTPLFRFLKREIGSEEKRYSQ